MANPSIVTSLAVTLNPNAADPMTLTTDPPDAAERCFARPPPP